MSQHESITLTVLIKHISQYGLKVEPFVEPCNYVTSREGEEGDGASEGGPRVD